MGIPVCREKQYTNDGCNVYECLLCKFEWELRGSMLHWEAGYWKFCPHCGCQWEKIIDGKNKWVRFYEEHGKWPSGEPGTTQAWMLEERTVNKAGSVINDWKRCDFLAVYTPASAKNLLAEFQGEVDQRIKEDMERTYPFTPHMKVEFRFHLVHIIGRYSVQYETKKYVYSSRSLWL